MATLSQTSSVFVPLDTHPGIFPSDLFSVPKTLCEFCEATNTSLTYTYIDSCYCLFGMVAAPAIHSIVVSIFVWSCVSCNLRGFFGDVRHMSSWIFHILQDGIKPNYLTVCRNVLHL
jgi:hypothetical protein